MTPDEMKTAWDETSRRLDRLESIFMEERCSSVRNEKSTALDRLAKRYLTFSRIALIAVVYPLIFAFNPGLPLDFRLGFSPVFALFFCICSVMDYWLYKGIRGIDVTRMNVEEVASASRYYKKWHIIFVCILIPMALGICAWLASVFISDNLMLISMIVGFCVGLAIGIRKLMDFFSDYRKLI